ncbi:sodium-coupled monocarboxylate transporter 1-like [Lycorma delicatula]|uniref:sodium-coupled monocarboxylate transporter 1-like n=1 Tax=Lycorma delicatula TaxID=130591 RepID=UPI003F50E0B5
MAYYSLGILDIIVILFCLLFSALIGIYYHFVSRDMETLQDYLLANKKGSIWSVSLSITATYFTAAAILSGPSESYSFGSQLVMIYVTNVLLLPVIIYLYFPVFYKMQLISPYQYLEKRFNYGLRIFASAFSCLVSTFNSGITLYIPALALETMTGFPVEWAIVIISVTCTFYATISGIRGVIMTDVFQAIIFFGSLILILVVATIEKGGVLPVLESAYKGGRMQFFNFDTDLTVRYTFWNTMIGGGLGQLSFCVVTETQVQRYMTLKSKKEAVQTIVTSTFMIMIVVMLSHYAGLALFAIYEYCDPVE